MRSPLTKLTRRYGIRCGFFVWLWEKGNGVAGWALTNADRYGYAEKAHAAARGKR